MSRKVQDLQRLKGLANLVLDQELAQLAEVTGRRDLLLAEIADLQASLATFLNQSNRDQNVVVSQNDAKWQNWRRYRRRELNIELANLEAEREAARATAKIAFGRSDVMEKILKMAKP